MTSWKFLRNKLVPISWHSSFWRCGLSGIELKDVFTSKMFPRQQTIELLDRCFLCDSCRINYWVCIERKEGDYFLFWLLWHPPLDLQIRDVIFLKHHHLTVHASQTAVIHRSIRIVLESQFITVIRDIGGTELHTGRSRIRFPMRSSNFLIGLKLPAALWPWVRLLL
jgi:hypothetical protein